MPTTRFLRKISTAFFSAYAVYINSNEPACYLTEICEQADRTPVWSITNTEPQLAQRDEEGAVVESSSAIPFIEYGTAEGDPVAIARRIAEGEFDDDVRFEVTLNPEPDDRDHLYFVQIYGIPSQRHLETHHSADGYGMVQAHREAQAWQAENPGRYLMEREDELEFGR